jgi:glycosyltransferase involved in cell wall biosynthesis
MNIAWVSSSLPYLPARGGFELCGGNLIMRLSQRHRLELISFLRKEDEPHVDWARQYCGSVSVIPVRRLSFSRRFANFASGYLWGRYLNHRVQLQNILNQGLKSRRWDIMHIEGSFAAGLMPDVPVPTVLSMHDAEALRAREMLNCRLSIPKRIAYNVRKYYEPRYARLVYPRFDRCVVIAERDLAFNQTLVPEANFDMVPNGTDTDYFRPLPAKKEKVGLVFHGHLSYAPNVQAALEFANDVFPLIRRMEPEATFHLIGADPSPDVQALTTQPGVRLSANLPDLRSAVCSASVYVCPIRHGTGMKNKVLEAMAMQMPIVCYPGGSSGINCAPGEHLLLAQNAGEFVAHVLTLLHQPDRAQKIARAGRQLVVDKYSWESRAQAYEQIYESVIRERRNVGRSSSRRVATSLVGTAS